MTDPAREAAERIVQLESAIEWALGANGDFAERQPGQGAYWWRTELRKRAGKTQFKYDKEARTLVAIPPAQPGDREALARAINCALPFPAGFDDDDAGGRRALCYSAADAILASGFRRDGVKP